MDHEKNAPADRPPSGRSESGPSRRRTIGPVWPPSPELASGVTVAALLVCIALDAPLWGAGAIAFAGLMAVHRLRAAREAELLRLVGALMRRIETLEDGELEPELVAAAGEAWRDRLDDWNARWLGQRSSIAASQALVALASGLPRRIDETLVSIAGAADRQEAAVEETAALVANMRQSMLSVAGRVDQLSGSTDQSASAVLELGSSIEEVANNTASLHEVVEASTSSVHQMGESIKQVATGAEQVQSLAEETATSMYEMDRSVQEVSSNALEAASLTERAHQGASAGRDAVDATISDIEQISALTTEAMDRLDGLVSRISQIGTILQAIGEINDETNLLSLNAAIIAAQAGEQGKAFLVVANHVKTLARRTAGSTQDIEALIGGIQADSNEAVRAMRAGIEAVAGGVDRSRDAGRALESIQDACSEASERVGEIARATSEQSRGSKGVAEATQRTSHQLHQISQAIAEQRRASEEMLEAARSALDNCLSVHRSTDEQRETSRHITSAIGEISEMIREIGSQTRTHAEASEAVTEAVTRLIENARVAGASADPLREPIAELGRVASAARWPDDAGPGANIAGDPDGDALA